MGPLYHRYAQRHGDGSEHRRQSVEGLISFDIVRKESFHRPSLPLSCFRSNSLANTARKPRRLIIATAEGRRGRR